MFYSPKTTQKSKQDLEILINTSWELSYNLGGTTYISQMKLTEYAVSAETEGVTGKFYRDKNGTESDGMACGRAPAELTNILKVDYMCTVVSSPMLVFGFKISGSNITNGVVASGGTVEEAAKNFMQNNSPVTGNLIEGGNPTSTTGDEASFDETKNELVIPVVNYKGGKYRVILQDSGNFVFTIKGALPVN